jgi:lon-related putative ATP-dependent protease
MRNASKAAARLDLRLEEEEDGLHMVPLLNGKPFHQEAYEKLSASKRRRIEGNMVAFQEHLEAYSYRRRQLELEHHERLLAAEMRAIRPLVKGVIEPLLERYRRFGEEVTRYLKAVQEHILSNHRIFLPMEEVENGETDEEPEERSAETLRIYQVNVVVDRTEQQGSPVIVEQVPSPTNLCGYFEYRADQGRLATDHTMIRAGALHQANGGYLLLQMSDLLMHENSWDSLKRALRHKHVRIEEEAGLGEGKVRIAGTLKPGSVPLRAKVILIGGIDLYYLLKIEDENFGRLFKVMAEFEGSMQRTRPNVIRMARFLGQVCREEGYLPIHRSGMSRLVEIASRRAEHKERMNTHRAELLDLLAEANFFACQSKAKAIRKEDVDQAIGEVERRHGASADAVDRAIREGVIFLKTRGTAVGQINGIALYDLAGTSFGMPVRITVRTYAGREGLLNIDREVNLSGAIHDKGAMILGGYLGGRYAQEQTLGMSASITFEQSYDEIDGDSASSAELYALLSSLTGCPIRQGIAVTGSINQLGEIQPIGGVNEKVEGIYRICKSRSLSGEEGVMIPKANLKNLMLSEEVVEVVRRGLFHIYAVSTVDEGIEVLSGLPAGKQRKDGRWTTGSINDRVQTRLKELQLVLRSEGISCSNGKRD